MERDEYVANMQENYTFVSFLPGWSDMVQVGGALTGFVFVHLDHIGQGYGADARHHCLFHPDPYVVGYTFGSAGT